MEHQDFGESHFLCVKPEWRSFLKNKTNILKMSVTTTLDPWLRNWPVWLGHQDNNCFSFHLKYFWQNRSFPTCSGHSSNRLKLGWSVLGFDNNLHSQEMFYKWEWYQKLPSLILMVHLGTRNLPYKDWNLVSFECFFPISQVGKTFCSFILFSSGIHWPYLLVLR